MNQKDNDLDLVLSFLPRNNRDQFEKRAKMLLKYYKGDSSLRNQLRDDMELEKKWYESIEKENPLYELYELPDFAIEAWACFYSYSRKYIKMILSNKDAMNYISENVDSVLDVGCGVGLTCKMFQQELGETKKIVGFNVPGSVQYEIADHLARDFGFSVIGNLNEANVCNSLIFASEYFEHFFDPIAHLDQILDLNPRMLVIANSFTSISVGHFPKYKYKNEVIENKLMQRKFNQHLRRSGFGPLIGNNGPVRFWNNRPQIWIKK